MFTENLIDLQKWTEVAPHTRSKRLSPEKVYCRCSVTRYKTNRMTIYIGKEVANILNWKAGNNVKIFFNRINPTRCMILKSSEGFTLTSSKKANVLAFSFPLTTPFNVAKGKSVSVFFDLEKDKLLIDFSNEKVDQG